MLSPGSGYLPPPPHDRTGWPWVTTSVAETQSGDRLWPRITIVTPSFNQADYIEETIRSVLMQSYPNLEYMIIDGGSTDGTVEIIRKYERWLSYWVTERDQGQAHAIVKGFSRATGTLLGWINSDDLYLPDALWHVSTLHREMPHALIAGNVLDFDGIGIRRVVRPYGISIQTFLAPWRHSQAWHQPGVFFPRFAYEMVGGLDMSLRYAMDHDLMCRFLRLNLPVCYLERDLAKFRLHPGSKTVAENTNMALEIYRVSTNYWHLTGDSRIHLSLEMLLHLTGRAAKYLLRGSPQEASASIAGGLHMFTQVLKRK